MSHRENFPLIIVSSEFYIFFNFGEKKSILTYEKPELVGKLIQEKNSGDLGNSGRGICEKIYGGFRKLDNTKRAGKNLLGIGKLVGVLEVIYGWELR
jgi:hypothetical protein